MKFTTDYKAEEYILNTKWEDLTEAVQKRMKGCFIDLMGALISGSMSNQFRVCIQALTDEAYTSISPSTSRKRRII